jgi:TetR/AcrR family transcriptional regulator, regulator of biofilm formation and stress response
VVRMSAEARRAQLLQAALRVMARDGLAAGTTRAIVAEAGMSLATFHYCFRSRNELLRELIILVTTLERDAIRSAMLPGDDFRETLRRALHGYLEHLADNPGHELFLFELNHHALRTPELRDLADEQYRRYYESAERLLSDAAELAGMTWQVELPVLARLVVIVIDGATTTWLVDQDTEGTVSALETVIDHLATLATPGARPSTRSR